ncbi:uncharacterized protein ZBIST_1030 [Zygosaccharomyces bailii]|nr:uncharacterized protein ZBIST_1030 [Zygosaccharomyces bailii]
MTRRRKSNYHSRGKRRGRNRSNVRPSSRALAVTRGTSKMDFAAAGKKTRKVTKIFRNPLITKGSLSQIMNQVTSFKDLLCFPEFNSISRFISLALKFLSPVIFCAYGSLGFYNGRDNDISLLFSYTIPIIHALRQLIEYLNNAEALRLSIFDWGDKTYAEYFISPLLTDVVLLIIDVAGFIYHLVNGRQTPSIFVVGLLAYLNYLIVNIVLAF